MFVRCFVLVIKITLENVSKSDYMKEHQTTACTTYRNINKIECLMSLSSIVSYQFYLFRSLSETLWNE